MKCVEVFQCWRLLLVGYGDDDDDPTSCHKVSCCSRAMSASSCSFSIVTLLSNTSSAWFGLLLPWSNCLRLYPSGPMNTKLWCSHLAVFVQVSFMGLGGGGGGWPDWLQRFRIRRWWSKGYLFGFCVSWVLASGAIKGLGLLGDCS